MFKQPQLNARVWLILITSHCLITTFAYPQSDNYQRHLLEQQQQQQQQQQSQHVQQHQQLQHQQLQQQQQQQPEERDMNNERMPVYRPTAKAVELNAETGRKLAVKSNALKKVALDDIDADLDNSNNHLMQEAPTGFSWSNMLSTFLNMFFSGGGVAPSKSDDIDTVGGFGSSPWANVISMGLKIINALLGGGAPSDGIDKIDNGSSPMQGILAAVLSSVLGTKDPEQVNSMAKQAGEFIQIVMNLLDALKTSFSHRSLMARSSGRRDSVSDAAVASISMLKGYVRTYRNTDEKCLQRYMCEANNECVREIGGTSIFCQLGSYATSYMLDRSSGGKFEHIYEAGRRGRSGFDCTQLYLECNEV